MITRQERETRAVVATINQGLAETNSVMSAPDEGTIRAEALATFTAALDERLANLQEGEQIQITYRVDIISLSGEVRGGSGRQRNMPEYVEWRAAVYERDAYTCQKCGQGHDIEAHHIKAWATHPKHRFALDNGITLCKRCHRQEHRASPESPGL